MKKITLLLMMLSFFFILNAQPVPTNYALNKPVTGNGTNLSYADDASATTYCYGPVTTTLTIIIDLQANYYLERMDGSDIELKADGTSETFLYYSSDAGISWIPAIRSSLSGNLYGYEINTYANKIKIELKPYMNNPSQFRIYDVKAWGLTQPITAFYSRLGIGTTDLSEALNINGNIKVNNITASKTLNAKVINSNQAIVGGLFAMDDESYYLKPADLYTSLKVKGNIITEKKIEAEEIEVKEIAANTINTVNIKASTLNLQVENIADYVFDDDYKLMNLFELNNYISANKHLPEIPSAIEFENKGMDVAEMNNLLLKKIEELTLYIIEQNKRIEALEKNK